MALGHHVLALVGMWNVCYLLGHYPLFTFLLLALLMQWFLWRQSVSDLLKIPHFWPGTWSTFLSPHHSADTWEQGPRRRGPLISSSPCWNSASPNNPHVTPRLLVCSWDRLSWSPILTSSTKTFWSFTLIWSAYFPPQCFLSPLIAFLRFFFLSFTQG